jgi:hypothetical protein
MSTESDPIILPGTVNDSVLEVIVTGDTPAEPSSDVSDVVVVSKATAVEASTSPDSQQSTSPPSDPLVFSGQSVWRADQSGSASANEINVGGLIQAVFSDTDKRAILLSQYGLVDLSVPQNSPTPTLRSVTFFEGQSGSWSESTNIYVPSWDIAFSQDAVTVFFQIAYDVADPLRPTSILEGLTADLKLVFNQASLAFLQSAQSGSAPLLLTNLDDIGIALAFGHDRQVALGRPADTLAVSIDSSLNIEGELPFTSEAFFAALELISSSTPVFKDPTPVTRSLQILSIHDDTGSSSSDFITNTNGPLTIKGTSFGFR